jgi:hypothetical protein
VASDLGAVGAFLAGAGAFLADVGAFFAGAFFAGAFFAAVAVLRAATDGPGVFDAGRALRVVVAMKDSFKNDVNSLYRFMDLFKSCDQGTD